MTINQGNSSTIIINSARPSVRADYMLEFTPTMNKQAKRDDMNDMKDRSANLKTLAKCLKQNASNEKLRDEARKIRSMLTASYEPEKADKLLEAAISNMC